jgi:hypothetical protein
MLKIRKDSSGRRLFLGVSDHKERWNIWAGAKSSMLVTQQAFIPSILYICVGISIIIILSNFISQIATAIIARE